MKPHFPLLVACLALTGVARADTATDKSRFDYHCRKCHDVGGTGTFMLERRLGKDKALLETRTDLADSYIRSVVRNGVMSMPWISRVELTDAELDAIARYLTRTSR